MAKGTLKESDARSQYRCGWVGRGIQPPSTPQPTSHTLTYTKTIYNARFPTFQLDDLRRTDGRTDRRMDRRMDGQTKPLIELCVRK